MNQILKLDPKTLNAEPRSGIPTKHARVLKPAGKAGRVNMVKHKDVSEFQFLQASTLRDFL